MFLSEELQQKWQPVLDHEDLDAISDPYRKTVTSVLLENQEIALREQASYEGRGYGSLTEATPLNATGGSGDGSSDGIDNYDPVLISLVRRAMPNLVAYDVCGVQPMTGPTGLIFALRAAYVGGTTASRDIGSKKGSEAGQGVPSEALFNEANTSFATSNTGYAGDIHAGNGAYSATKTGNAISTALAEALGNGASNNDFREMGFVIDKVTVTAMSRALKAEYTIELAQDLKAIHGLDAETELANILSAEILAEINREVIRVIVSQSAVGAANGTAASGTFDLDVDANGRWSVEKFKGLMFQIEREANAIAKATRRGRGNIVICSSDVASALSMAGILDHTPALKDSLTVDDTGNTFAGILNGKYKVFIDPYQSTGVDFATVGYKGSSAYDAGFFYCPYVPLQMVRAVGEANFQPKIGFKTRYGLVNNPFATNAGNGVIDHQAYSGGTVTDPNIYYRTFAVNNLL
jgi:hypothetical protein